MGIIKGLLNLDVSKAMDQIFEERLCNAVFLYWAWLDAILIPIFKSGETNLKY